MKHRQIGRRVLWILFLFLAISLVPVCVQAAKKTGWVKSEKQYYYYNTKGKKVHGLKKIDQKYYYFGSDGRQLTGWQKVGTRYYFFRIKAGSGGYMKTGCTVNKIRLAKNGRAVLSGNKDRLKALTIASTIVNTVTNPEMSRAKKMKTVWAFLQKNFEYTGTKIFYYSENWEVDYALEVFATRKGNCYGLGAAWAFLANACGCGNAAAVSSGGHGWAEIGDRIYDPSWERIDLRNHYYGRKMSDSGKNDSPEYARSRFYIRRI